MAKPSLDTFIKEYILLGCKNAKQAAIKAGYSEKTADQQGSRLLKNVKVISAIKEHNLMMGHNAPTESTSIIKVEKSLADRLTNASKR